MGFPEDMLKGPYALENLTFPIGNYFVPLRALGRLNIEKVWDTIRSVNGLEAFNIDIYKKDSSKEDKQIVRKRILDKIKAHEVNMASISFEDPEKEFKTNTNSLLLALFMSLILVWIVITFQFGSLRNTVIIMLAVPLGLIGVGISLFLFKSTLSVNSLLGTILLCGISVNNSILFVDFFNYLKMQSPHTPLQEVLLKTARFRLRPILITTGTTILGMLPIAFKFGSGGEVLQPLGIAVSGGLWLSTLLTLLLVPTILFLVEKSRDSQTELI